MTNQPFDAPTSAIDDITGDYVIDASHTTLGFSTRHAMVTTVRGRFGEFEGTAHVDSADPSASKIDVTIQAASIDTGSPDRDGHLASADFFDVENHPTLRFVSTDVKRDGEDWVVTGDFTIKDVTRPLTITFEPTGSARDPFGNLRIGFEGEAVVSRKDWGLSWNAALETGGVLVSDKVKLQFDVSAIQQ